MRIETDKIYCGDSLQVLQTLPDNCLDCCVTSPPYYALRDYGTDGQIGREATPEEYVSRITAVFHEVKRVLTPEGTCWLNIADTYCGTGSKADHQDPKYPKGRNGQQVAVNHRAPGCKPKDLIGIPWLVALALRGDGWYLRSSIIWHKGSRTQAKIAGQDRKVFTDKAAMEKYLNGRIKAYDRLFTEISPPIPQPMKGVQTA